MSVKQTLNFLPKLSGLMLLGLAACTTAADPAAFERQPERPANAERMNVLFIVSDDLRVGGAFGSDPVHTPNIDRLGNMGVEFTRAYSQFPLCGPSRASFLTGLRPNTLRVYDLDTHVRSNLPDVLTMPQHFRQNGYFTARVGKMFHQGVPGEIGMMPDRHDDAASWDVAINPAGRDKLNEEDGGVVNLTPQIGLGIAFAYREDDGADDEQTDGMVASQAIQLIEAHRDEPFFMAVGFYRPHVPEIAPRHYFERYRETLWSAESEANVASILPAARGPAWGYIDRFAEQLTVEERASFVRSYYAAATYMDAQVGRLLDALEVNGLADNTIVVFTSDHGFNLGEHGSWQKLSLWEESTHVPLTVYVPDQAGNGRDAAGLVELLDIFPTLADMAGLPVPDALEGRSLRPLLSRPDGADWDFPALSQVPGGQSVRYRGWRYSEWGAGGANGVEFYDLASDPGEYHNLAANPAHAGLIAHLRTMLPGDPPPSTGPRLPSEQVGAGRRP